MRDRARVRKALWTWVMLPPLSERADTHCLIGRPDVMQLLDTRCKLTGKEIWGVFLSVLRPDLHSWLPLKMLDCSCWCRAEFSSLIPQSPQRPLRSSLCCPTAAAFYRSGHESTSLEDGLWGADPYQPICTHAATQDSAETKHTYLCTLTHMCKVNIYQWLMYSTQSEVLDSHIEVFPGCRLNSNCTL